MTQSLELLLDDDLDAAIRAQWDAIMSVGVPSQAKVNAASNRPHITLAAARRLSPTTDSALTQVAMRLPLTIRIGAPIVFGVADRRTLARLVVGSSELYSLHAQTLRLASPVDPYDHSLPGQWTPHITLARRVDAEQVAAALEVLDNTGRMGTASALRRWDGDAKVERIIAGRAC